MVSDLTTGCEAEFWSVSTLDIKNKVALQSHGLLGDTDI